MNAEQKDSIKALVEQGLGYKEIGRNLDLDRETVRAFVRRNGWKIAVKRSPWQKWEIDLAKEMLKVGHSPEEISKRLPARTPKAINDKNRHDWKILQRGDLWTEREEEIARKLLEEFHDYDKVAKLLPGRTRTSIKIRNGLKWKIRVPHGKNLLPVEDAFDKWTPRMAYLLGFLVSDGNVRENNLSWGQSHLSGQQHLEALWPYVGGNIYGPDKKDGYRLVVYSRHLSQRVQQLGVPPAKSLIVHMPDVPQEVLDHFVRGVVDGDGCFRNPADKKRKERPRVQAQIASGSKRFRDELSERLCFLGIKGRNSGIELIFRLEESLVLAEWLWKRKEESFWLPRRLKQFEDLVALREGTPDKRELRKRDRSGRLL